jgi:hypothetical protein
LVPETAEILLPRRPSHFRGRTPGVCASSALLLILFLGTHAAASINHTWSAAFGDTRWDGYGASVSVDASGNLFVSGGFGDSVDLGGGTLDANGWRDIFLAKFDADGNHLWSRSFGGPRDEQPVAALVDPWNSLITTGRFWGMLNLGGGAIGLGRKYNLYLAKYDAAGRHVWSRSFASEDTGHHAWVDGAALDRAGSVFLTGHFSGTLDMGGTEFTSTDGPMFLCRYDTSGAHLWSLQGGDAGLIDGGIDVDALDNVFVTGNYDSLFSLSKYDTTGARIWNRRFTPTSFVRNVTPAADGYGDVFVAGMFAGTMEFDGIKLFSDDRGSIFVARFDGNGNHVWSRAFSSEPVEDTSRRVRSDALGNVLVTGVMNGTIDFGNRVLTSAGGSDVFLVKFGGDGRHLWSRNFGGSGQDVPNDVHMDPNGRVYLTGAFEDTAGFGGDPLVSVAKADIFVARYDVAAINFFDAHALADAVHLYSAIGPDLGVEAVDVYRAEASGPLSRHSSVPHAGGPFHYEDRHFTPGRAYRYRLGVVTLYGESFSHDRTVTPPRHPTALLPPAPNPFNPETTIRYTLSDAGPVTLSIYSVEGRRITTLVDGHQSPGPHSVLWNGTNASGDGVGSGVYFCRLESQSGVLSNRMVLLK